MRALNTDTFKELFESYDNKEKDIFVFFTGPTCFNCPEIWPLFERTVRILHGNSPDLIFVYIDLGENEMQDMVKVY